MTLFAGVLFGHRMRPPIGGVPELKLLSWSGAARTRREDELARQPECCEEQA